MRKLAHTGRSGLTLVEACITLSLLGLVFGSLGMLIHSAQGTYRAGVSTMQLEREGSLAMARIAAALRAADLDSLSPTAAPPFSSSLLNFQRNEGFDGKQTVWSDPQRIAHDPAAGRALWIRNPGLPGEEGVTWSRKVAPFLEGEALSGTDTNGNGLIDEPGLCFTREGDLVTVRLTLEAPGPGGSSAVRSWTTKLYCRN